MAKFQLRFVQTFPVNKIHPKLFQTPTKIAPQEAGQGEIIPDQGQLAQLHKEVIYLLSERDADDEVYSESRIPERIYHPKKYGYHRRDRSESKFLTRETMITSSSYSSFSMVYIVDTESKHEKYIICIEVMPRKLKLKTLISTKKKKKSIRQSNLCLFDCQPIWEC